MKTSFLKLSPFLLGCLCIISICVQWRAWAHSAENESVLSHISTRSAGQAQPDMRIYGHRIFRRAEGNGYLLSYISSGSIFGGTGWFLNAYDRTGKQEWVRTYHPSLRTGSERALTAIELQGGGFLVGVNGAFGIERLGSDGQTVWSRELLPLSSTPPTAICFYMMPCSNTQVVGLP
ncbi:MAG TPA: hypothetical protein VEH27_09965 [Methylomirabilota bacterium]|nr:hypothetical protein [Methylomirabilota bacterium]